MPVILPRAGFTLVDAKANKLLRKYGLTVEDVWSGSQDLRHRMERRSVSSALTKNFDRNQRQIAKMLSQLGKQIEKLDPTPKRHHGTHARENRISDRQAAPQSGARNRTKKTGLISTHEQYLESLLYPHKGPQERELCLLPFLARWGAGG